MNKMDVKALIKEVDRVYNKASQYVDYSRFDAYELARKIIDMIEQKNGKKLEVKRSFTLLHGDKNE